MRILSTEGPVEIDNLRRSDRRHQSDRMKRRAARIRLIWARGKKNSLLIKSSTASHGIWNHTYYTPQEIRAVIGRLAAMHCTHVCGMCKYEKIAGIPRIKSGESVRVFDL